MSTLSGEAKDVIMTLELIQAHRAHIARRQNIDSSTAIGEMFSHDANLLRIDTLKERINNLLGGLSHAGYEVEFHENMTTVLKHGQKWLQHSNWTEYPVNDPELAI